MTPVDTSDEIDAAIETFVGGFTFTRSFTHPYVGERIGPLWVMRDGPRKRGEYRSEEWVCRGTAPPEVDALVREHTRGRFAVCAVHGTEDSGEGLRTGFKSRGYRLVASEPFMVHLLDAIPAFDSPAAVEQVLDQPLADRLTRAARSRQILSEHLAAGSRLRQYVAQVEGELVGWVRSIVVGEATWCSNMFVAPAHRRKGIAKALLSRLLADDRTHGARRAVLLSSHTGALLYPVVGYRQIGTLLIFTPGRP